MRKIVILIITITTFAAFGQTTPTLNYSNPTPFIEVTGTAQKEVVPDQIYISILLTEKTVNNQDYSIQFQEEKLREIVAKNNIDSKNLFLSDAISEITKSKRKETGIKLTREFTLILKDADEVLKIFQELTNINIKEISVRKTEHSGIDAIRREVRENAIKVAKEKAEYLLAAIGEQLGKPLEINEINDSSLRSNLAPNVTSSYSSNDGTSFEKIVVKFTYYIKYSIK